MDVLNLTKITIAWEMYEGYRDDAKSILEIFDHPELVKSIPPLDYVSEERQRRDTYIQKYFELYKKSTQIRDWRKLISTMPIPKGCTKENTTFPNTSRSIDWNRDENETTPSSVPIDPYTVS